MTALPRRATLAGRLAGGNRIVPVLLAAILARAATFGNPIVHVDEQFYFVAARAWLNGALPYVGVWDRKPVGLFAIYLPAAALGLPLGIWAYQAMALASIVATALLVARLADRAGWGRGALGGAIAYVLWADLLEGQGGQAPIFYNLVMAGAAALAAPRDADDGGLARSLAAMALVGIALQIKYAVVFEGAFFGGWLLLREWRLARRWRIAAVALALVAVAALPTAIAWFSFHLIGAGDAWSYANVTSILARRADPVIERYGNLAKMILIVSPLAAAAILARGRGDDARRAAPAMRRWLLAWLGISAFGVLVFGTWFDHYALPLIMPAACCASGFFGDHPVGRRIVLPLLVAALIGGQVTVIGKRVTRGTPAQFAALVRAIGRGPECLYVYSGDPMLYPASGRCALSRYVFPSHLTRIREDGAIGVDQLAEIGRIMDARPAVVVVRPFYSGERLAAHAVVAAHLRRDYVLRATLPLGNLQMRVFALARDGQPVR